MSGLEKPTIMVVDDKIDNIKIIYSILEQEGYNIAMSTDAQEALKSIDLQLPDLILLDIVMPGLNGFEMCKILKEKANTAEIPVIFITAQSEAFGEYKGLELGAVDYLTKPVNSLIVKARVRTHLNLYKQKQHLEYLVKERTDEIHMKAEELKDTRFEIINRLGIAAEYKDNETGNHVKRMSDYSCCIAAGLNKTEYFIDVLRNASPMHDVGKIGIPDSILLKKGPLTSEEFSIMKTHSKIGHKIIGEHSSDILRIAASVALTHHERWDGKGYPNNLKESEIPLEGRIVSIADVFDALTSKRPYKPAWPLEKAINEIIKGGGTQFDPNLVEVFLECLSNITYIYDNYKD